MRPRTLVLSVAVVVAVLYGLATLIAPDLRRPNFEILPADMVHPVAAETGDLTTAFADHLVDRVPPQGTIPRGVDLGLLEYGPTPEEAVRAGQELVNPLPDTPAVRARGAVVFKSVCSCCHGLSAAGDGMVPKRGFPPPPTFYRPETKALRDGEMWHAVTFGRKNMPSLAAVVGAEDRWAALRHVRALLESEGK